MPGQILVDRLLPSVQFHELETPTVVAFFWVFWENAFRGMLAAFFLMVSYIRDFGLLDGRVLLEGMALYGWVL